MLLWRGSYITRKDTFMWCGSYFKISITWEQSHLKCSWTFMSISSEIALRWLTQNLIGDTPTSVHVMAWYRKALLRSIITTRHRHTLPVGISWLQPRCSGATWSSQIYCLFNSYFRQQLRKIQRKASMPPVMGIPWLQHDNFMTYINTRQNVST